jgi:hypothetical protein
MYEMTVPVTNRMESGPRLVHHCSQYLKAHRLTGFDRLVMSRTTTSVDPRRVTNAREAPAGIVDEQEKATGFGVDGAAVTGLGSTNGVGDAGEPGEAPGLEFSEGLAIATGVVSGVCIAPGFAFPHAARSRAVATRAAFLMLVTTPGAISSYESAIMQT